MLLPLAALAQLASAAPAVKDGWFATSDGVRLHYLEAGRGPTIVFEPGWTMPAGIWEPQIRHFSEHYRVVALDPRSQGQSQKPAEGHFPERRSRDIKELVEHLQAAPAVLVGWSMGVGELLTYAEQFGTSSVRAMVLVDGLVGTDPSPRQAQELLGFLRQIQADRPRFTDKFVRSMYKKPQPEGYLKKIIAASLGTPTNTAVTLIANSFLRWDWRGVLAKVQCPVLYVYTPELQTHASELKARLPSARLELFADAGHAVFVDEAERFNRLLDSFLGTPSPQ